MDEPRRVPIRWRDMDAFGHVNNAVYLTYGEDARDAYFKRVLDDATADRIVLRRIEVDYLSPLTLEDGAVDVEVEVTGVGRSSVVTSERLRAVSDGRLAATLSTVAVYTSPDGSSSQPLPQAVRERLEAQLAAQKSAAASRRR
jgi:acyl-CoA thioester hydrolase